MLAKFAYAYLFVCIYYIQIAESFAHCLGGLMSTSAQGIQLQISLEDGVHIKEVHTTRPFEKLNNDRRLDKFLQRFFIFRSQHECECIN